MTDILADTKAGDSLCLLERLPGPYPDRLSQIMVTRTTKTQVHAGRNGITFVFARNGRTIPRGSDKFSACPMTPELSMQMRAQHATHAQRRTPATGMHRHRAGLRSPAALARWRHASGGSRGRQTESRWPDTGRIG
jgi:hypothetical protein